MAQKNYISLSKLSTFLDNLKTTFASLNHKHTITDIEDYTVDTQLSSTSTNPVQNKTLDAEFEAISNAMGALDLAIDNKADSSHTHDDIYYTETEIDTILDTNFGNVENKSSATIRGEITKENVTDALGYTPPMTDTTYSAITDDEIDEICAGTIETFLESIAVEEVSF